MIKIETFSDLVREAIKFKGVIYDDCQLEKGYYHNFGILGFIYKGDKYIIPHSSGLTEILINEGFALFDMYLPQPTDLRYSLNKEEKKQWKLLTLWSQAQRKKEFSNQCLAYCRAHGFKPITQDELNKCTIIPKEGYLVFNEQTRRWRKKVPVSAAEYFTREIAISLGKYNISSYGWLCFLYNDGEMYITKDSSVLDALIHAGYTRSPMIYVPNNEVKFK